MSIKDAPTGVARVPVQQNKDVAPAAEARSVTVRRPTGAQVLAVLRITMGLTFLWAFLDKTFGLGYSTSSSHAWINGGSPTKGFLGHVEVGPFQGMLRDWAGQGWADWLFMIGLAAIGLALILGIGVRIAATTGVLLLAFMWFAEFPIARFDSTGAATSSTNPFIDYHLVYAVVLVALAVFAAGETWGFGRMWAKLDFVARNPWLR